MQNEDQLQNIEVSIEEAKKVINLKNSFISLSSNKDFQTVIENSYFKDESARLVMAKSAGLTPEQQANIDNMIYGIGALYNFFNTLTMRGVQMEDALRDDEQAREEILREGLA
jgi:hypothetical protein